MITDKKLRITMPDGSKYDVPISVIAENRAENYKDEFDNNIAMSLMEDTLPLFESSPYEITDWAAGNMNWSDVAEYAEKVGTTEDPDFQEGWVNGEKEVV
ncbi:MAG: hypothetical protein R6V27_05550 [Balneolaceae bacterium]